MPACKSCTRYVSKQSSPCVACPVVRGLPWSRAVVSALLAWSNPDEAQRADGMGGAMPNVHVAALRDKGMTERNRSQVHLTAVGKAAWKTVHAAWEGLR